MTITDPTTRNATLRTAAGLAAQEAPTRTGFGFELVAFDLYRDIHKGIRAELFAVTGTAGSVDPSDREGVVALAGHVASIAGVLESHAEHEDAVIEPALARHRPDLASQVSADHHVLEARFSAITEIASTLATSTADQRRLAHLLYLELTGFTSAYLAHQIVEERVVMPALEQAVGVDAVVAMHVAIVGSIPPDEMGRSLGFMLPAMNVDDRTEMLAGMREGMPPEAFAGVVSLARSVLEPADFAGLAGRLGLTAA